VIEGRKWVCNGRQRGDERVYDVHVGTDKQSDDSEAEEARGADGRPDGDVGVVCPGLCCVSSKTKSREQLVAWGPQAYHPE